MITAQGGEPDDAVFEMDLDLGPHHLWHAATFDTLAPSGKRDVERLQSWLDEHLKGLDPNAAPADLVKEVRFFFFSAFLHTYRLTSVFHYHRFRGCIRRAFAS